MSRHRQLMMALATLKEEDNYIHFEDDAVLQVLLANGVGDGIGVTYDDAAKVTTFGSIFKGNTDITAFDELESFTSFTYIDNNSAFYGCTNLKSINIENIVDLLSNRSELQYGIFNGCINLENIGNTAKLETIGNNMFYKCEKLRGCFSFPSLKSIKAGAFNGSAIQIIMSLGEVTELPGSELGWSSSGIFQNCASLLKINIPERLKKIGNNTFQGCSALTEIAFPASLTSIGSSAFNRCSSLTYIKILATTPPTLASTNAIPSTIGAIYVPDESIEAYKTATNWSSFASKIKGISEMPTE